MFKVGDRVKLCCVFNNGAYGTITETRYDYRPECNDGELYMPVRVRRDHESGDGLWFHLCELQLIKEEKGMFEVGKKYLNIRCATKGDIAEVLLISGTGVCLEWKREKRLFTLDQKSFSDGWKEYVEPKVLTQELFVRSNGETIWTNNSANGSNLTLGRIRITHTEGSGLTVEVIEGADTGTI